MMKTLVRTCLFLFAVVPWASWSGVVSEAPGWTFAEDDPPSFQVTVSGAKSWNLTDWRGRPCGVATNDASGALRFPRQSPGYYWVSGGGTNFAFCVVRREPCRSSDSFFAADSALTECSRPGQYACPWHKGDSVRATAELLGVCGIVHTRERLYWREAEPERGRYDFSRWLASARKLKENGVKALGLFADTPKWMRRPGRSLPGDLVATYRFMRAAVAAFDGYYDAWEFWNEPELISTREPVWEYVAALKAAALGGHAGNARAIILPGSLARLDAPSRAYGLNVFDGEIAKYMQAFNVHTYLALTDYCKFARDIETFLADVGIPGVQVWLTECGTELEGDALAVGPTGLGAHSPEQEMIVAEFYPKSNVLNRFNGIFRNWFFLFGCYNERYDRKDWGSMRRDGCVKPVHAAMSALTGELGGAEMLGTVRVGKDVRAFLYRRANGLQTLVFWSPSPVDRGRTAHEVLGRDELGNRDIRLEVPDGTYRLVDMMGTPSAVTARNGSLELSAVRHPQYLTGRLGLRPEVAPRGVGKLLRYVPSADEDLTVVVRPETHPGDFAPTGRKCVAELEKERGRIAVEVWNLSDKPKRGRLAFSCGTAEGADAEIALPAWGKVDVPVVWTPPEGTAIECPLDISGTFGGKRITRVRIPVSYTWRFLRTCKSIRLPALDDPSAWRRNTSAQEYACRFDEAERAVRFDVRWNRKLPQWFYPVHDLSLPQESLEGVRYVEFEVKTAQDKVENDFEDVEFMLVAPGAQDRYLAYQPPTFGWEKRRVKLPDDAGRCTAIRVGVNPRGRALTFWMRNFKFLKECR